MALSITAANVVGNGNYETGIAGATITAGQAVYKDSSGIFQLADCDSAAAAKTVYGIAVNSALANQPLAVQRSGNITIGATVAAGTIYVLDGGAGGITTAGDLANGDRLVIVGYGISTTVVTLNIINTGIDCVL